MKRKTFAAVTSQQVAQLAGVSQSAVSRTFTPGASISPATREKVLKAARELGYRPNAIARSLNTARSRIIGVVISYFDNPFYSQVLEALAQKLDTLNYHLLLFVGQQIWHKNLRLVLDTAKTLKDLGGAYLTLLVGEGYDGAAIRA